MESNFDSSTRIPPDGGRRQRKAEATRNAIVESALTAFERQPIGLVSVLDITEAADVAKGVFYLHFKSKDEFLLQLWQRIHNAMLRSMAERISNAHDRDERIRGVLETYYNQAVPDARRARFCLRMSSFLSDEIGAPGQMCEILNRYLRELAQIICDAPIGKVDALSFAATLDATCWAQLWLPMRLNSALPSRDAYVQQLTRALR